MPQRIIFVPAILVILLAAVSSSARTSLAADGCAGRPGSTAPQGQHWYYRSDRTLHRPCWYLGPEGAKVTQAGVPRLRSAVRAADPHPGVLATAEPSAEALNAYAARTRVATAGNGVLLGENHADPSFTTRWPDRPDPSDANARELASTGNDDAVRSASLDGPAELSPAQQVPALSDRAVAGMSDETSPEFVRMLALIGGAFAFAGLIFCSACARPAARLVARSRSRDRQPSSTAVRPLVGAPSLANSIVAKAAVSKTAVAYTVVAGAPVAPCSPGAVHRSAGIMRRDDIASPPVQSDDLGHGFAAEWILGQATQDRSGRAMPAGR